MLDQKLIEKLYGRLERPLFNIALRWTWNEAEARELVQEAFVRLWSARWRVRSDTVEAYLYRIVLNLGQKHARRRESWGKISNLLPGADRGMSPEDTVDNSRLRDAIQSLPADLRNVLLLCEFSDLKQRQIAGLLDIAPGTVASRRHVAVKRLKEALGDGSD